MKPILSKALYFPAGGFNEQLTNETNADFVVVVAVPLESVVPGYLLSTLRDLNRVMKATIFVMVKCQLFVRNWDNLTSYNKS